MIYPKLLIHEGKYHKVRGRHTSTGRPRPLPDLVNSLIALRTENWVGIREWKGRKHHLDNYHSWGLVSIILP